MELKNGMQPIDGFVRSREEDYLQEDVGRIESTLYVHPQHRTDSKQL